MEKQAAVHMARLIRAFALVSLFCLPGLAQSLKSDPDSFVIDGSDTPIRIGALLPFSGGVEMYGEQAKLGIDLAAQEINSKGGILARPPQVIYADEGTRPRIAQTEPDTFSDLSYTSSKPPLEVTFKIAGGHYNGAVTGGNLFLQTDIPEAPLVRFSQAKQGKLYTLMMIDFDGDASGSWPDKVPPGRNSPVRHWIVGNIPGELLRGDGYSEDRQATPAASELTDRSGASGAGSGLVSQTGATVLQAYRHPHIPVVSDRYGIYLFEQEKRIEFDLAPDPITNFDYLGFLNKYQLLDPVASNWFVAIYTSEQPFSGKPFHGNDVSATWHQDLASGDLGRER